MEIDAVLGNTAMSKLDIIPLFYGGIKGIHIDVDDFPLGFMLRHNLLKHLI